MKKIKYILYILLFTLSFSIYSCKTNEQLINNTEISFGGQMYNTFESNFTLSQFDSICTVDKISKDLNKWHKLSGRDGETNQIYTIYMYIKSLGQSECIYRLVKNNDKSYKITKRIKNR
ncbi:hypothetical protein IKN40_00180 [bacterium]|nr:hypothetical protein [bacterium]